MPNVVLKSRKWLRELFSNQKKKVPTILLWSVVFPLAVVLLDCLAAFVLLFADAKLWDKIKK